MESEGSLSYSQEPATGPVLRQMSTVYTLPTYFTKIHFNIIFPSTRTTSE